MKKKSDNLRQKVFESYSTSVLEHEKEPKSVYLFCKELKIEEAWFDYWLCAQVLSIPKSTSHFIVRTHGT